MLILTIDIRTWYSNVQTHAADDVELILVGNKSDMEDKRVISYEQGQALARELGIEFIEASAKNNSNVDETFISLARRVKDKMTTEQQDRTGQSSSVNVGSTSTTSRSSCC
jgi:Ras-related protein Rab-8A